MIRESVNADTHSTVPRTAEGFLPNKLLLQNSIKCITVKIENAGGTARVIRMPKGQKAHDHLS